jgi:hypothetical protein
MTGIKRVDVNQSRHSTTAHGQWTWVSGDSKFHQLGDYGTKGVAVGTNKPGGRCCGISWIDSKGNLWLFGGRELSSNNFNLNDLWKFEP